MAFNFKQSGWLDQYLAFRQAKPLPPLLPSHGAKVLDDEGVHNILDQETYYFLQPIGLLYGSSVALPYPQADYPDTQYIDVMDRLVLSTLDATFAVLVADRHYQLAGLDTEADDKHLEEAVKVALYYHNHYPEAMAPKQGLMDCIGNKLFPKNKDKRLFEKSFLHRIIPTHHLNYHELFFNNFIFLDLCHLVLFQRQVMLYGEPSEELAAESYQAQLKERETLIRLLMVMAMANGVLDPEEKGMLTRFIQGAMLHPDVSFELKKRLDTGMPLEEVEIPPMPWLIRRYMLEVVLMMAMVDRTISPEEEALLAELVEKLGLWSEELEHSRIALEGFLANQGEKLEFFHKKPNLRSMRERMREKTGLALKKNKDRIMNEIHETKELYELLMKAKHSALDPEEKRKVKAQLMDILKTIPAVAIFALPGGGVILPILIKILPFNLMPSSFED